MLAAVDVQQHPRQRSSRPSPAVRPAFVSFGHQPGALQRLLHPGVAQPDIMLVLKLFVKMPDVQVVVLLAIQPQHLLHRGHRDPLWARLPLAPVCQAGVAELLHPHPPPAHRSVAHPDDFGRRQPGDLFRHRLQQHVLNLHHPLHLGSGVLLGFVHHPASPAPAQADRSRVNSTGQLTY